MTTPPRVRMAAELLAELPAILAAGGLTNPDQVTITQDSADVEKVRDLRPGVIILHPGPGLTWPMPGVTEATWKLDILGPATPLLETWGRLDAILHALRLGGLPMGEAAPGGLPRPAPTPDLPGYTITVTHQHLDRE